MAAAALLLLGACTGNSTPVAGVSPTGSGTSQASASAVVSTTPSVLASPSSSACPAIAPSALGRTLNCRLPLLWAPDNDGGGQRAHVGFAAFPSQSVIEDNSAPGGSLFYDRAYSKWLPVLRDAVSPDGRSYAFSKLAGNAYANSGSEVHVVDVATGVDRVIYTGSYPFAVLDFAAGGVYLTSAVPEGYQRGLWFLSAAGGSPPRLISSSIASPAVGGGAGWGIDFNPADPHPAPGGLEGPMNRLLRYDLATGAVEPWFYQPGASLYPLGFDANGHPFVRSEVPVPGSATFAESTEIWLVAAAGTATRLSDDQSASAPGNLGAVDSHGAWFSSGYGSGGASTVWLFAAGHMQAVAAVNLAQVSIAGGCSP